MEWDSGRYRNMQQPTANSLHVRTLTCLRLLLHAMGSFAVPTFFPAEAAGDSSGGGHHTMRS